MEKTSTALTIIIHMGWAELVPSAPLMVLPVCRVKYWTLLCVRRKIYHYDSRSGRRPDSAHESSTTHLLIGGGLSPIKIDRTRAHDRMSLNSSETRLETDDFIRILTVNEDSQD